MGRLEFELEVFSLGLELAQLPAQLFDFSVVSSLFDGCVGVVQFLELSGLEGNLLFLSDDLLLELLGLNINLVGSLGLVLDLLGQGGGHVLELILQHTDSLFGELRLLFEVVVSVSELVVHALLLKILLREEAELLLSCLSLSLDFVSFGVFLLQESLGLLSLKIG